MRFKGPLAGALLTTLTILSCRADVIIYDFTGTTTQLYYTGTGLDQLNELVPGSEFHGQLSYDTRAHGRVDVEPDFNPFDFPPDWVVHAGPLMATGFEQYFTFDGINLVVANPFIYVGGKHVLTDSDTGDVSVRVGGLVHVSGGWPFPNDFDGNPVGPYSFGWTGEIDGVNKTIIVPDGGSSLAMLGLAIAGCIGFRRWMVR